jgi:hypothetical protein
MSLVRNCLLIALFCYCTSARSQTPTPPPDPSFGPNPHLVGWANLVFPGLGATLRDDPGRGLLQFGYEGATFAGGYALSDRKGFSSLDGISDTFRPFNKSKGARNAQEGIESKMTSNILLEFSIKSHLVNTFTEYRDAFKERGITEGLDQHTAIEGMILPFSTTYIKEPDVWIPLALVAAAVTLDYATSSPGAITPLNGSSNALYSFNYGVWQPLGSGYPEEVAYRGFLQHELKSATGSPFLAVALQSLAFAFSHEPGGGRYSAALVGTYLGYLAEKHHGDLGPGATLHFWGDALLGVESLLLSNKAQHTTPQAGFSLQFNY